MHSLLPTRLVDDVELIKPYSRPKAQRVKKYKYIRTQRNPSTLHCFHRKLLPGPVSFPCNSLYVMGLFEDTAVTARKRSII